MQEVRADDRQGDSEGEYRAIGLVHVRCGVRALAVGELAGEEQQEGRQAEEGQGKAGEGQVQGESVWGADSGECQVRDGQGHLHDEGGVQQQVL